MKKDKDILENAMTELHYMAHRTFSTARCETIKWPEIDLKLEGMKLALEEDNSVAFKENYFYLLTTLRHQDETKREFRPEPEDPQQLAPEGTRELLNHLVDQIIGKLEEPQSSREKQPLEPNRKVQT